MTINAQHHNIEAERVMAMTDINIRSRNASTDFIERKVRIQKNCTLTWVTRFEQIFRENDFSKKTTYEGVSLEVKFKQNTWKVT